MTALYEKSVAGYTPAPPAARRPDPPTNLPIKNDGAYPGRENDALKKARPEKAGRLPRHLRDLKPEEVYEPEQAPLTVPVTAAMKEEAAALEALNLRPRHILPAHKRREMVYPAEHPSPRLASDFRRYHRHTLKAFAQALLPEPRGVEPAGFSFLRWLEKLTGVKKRNPFKPRIGADHDLTIILSYARRKPKITADDIAGLIGIKPGVAARYLEHLADTGDLTRYRHGAKAYYQSIKY